MKLNRIGEPHEIIEIEPLTIPETVPNAPEPAPESVPEPARPVKVPVPA